jgi:hypothetical protein
LNRVLGYKHDLVNMDPTQIETYLERKMRSVPLADFIGLKSESG